MLFGFSGRGHINGRYTDAMPEPNGDLSDVVPLLDGITTIASLLLPMLSMLLLKGKIATKRRRKKPSALPRSKLARSKPLLDHPRWPAFEAKMRAKGLSDSAIKAFAYNFGKLASGESLMISEDSIEAVDSLPSYDALTEQEPELLKRTVMLKLNGGLGTGMGLEKAKSLLPIREGLTFLDFIAKQVGHMRAALGVNLAFMLMNSFSTSADTAAFLSKYSALKSADLPLEFLQNMAPKVTASDFSAPSWPANPALEWCPPGHGDLYAALAGSGTLDELLRKGYTYMFVSNSDNLGATMDVKMLTWFARSKAPFAMEVAARTDADKKGGHLARSRVSGGLLLREAAQCADEDEDEFQNVGKHKFFNTNNLWLDLRALKKAIKSSGGFLPLPVISNSKTMDPRDKKSTKVLQLETAMGSAIECFPGAAAVLVPRTRFAPVKTTNDLLSLTSDAYEISDDFRMVLKPERDGVPPNVKLDGCYKFFDQLQKLVPHGAPSLLRCNKLTVQGEVAFAAGVVIEGDVKVINEGAESKTLPAGTYADQTIRL